MRRLVLAGLLPIVLAVPGLAADPVPPGRVVTEAEVLAVLDADHPAVAESAEALALARARLIAARTLENPSLELEHEAPSGPDGSAEATELMVSWKLPDRDRRPAIAAREHAVEAARLRLEDDLAALRAELRADYADWAVAAARRDRLAAQVGRFEALAERQRVRAERGESPGLEARRLALAAAAARTEVALAAAAADEGRGRLAAWVPELPPDARPELPRPLDRPELAAGPAEPPEPPRVAAARAEVAAAAAEVEAARRSVRSPAIGVGWLREEAGASSADGPRLGVEWSLPLLDRNRAERTAAEARLAAARSRLERVLREVTAARAAAAERVGRLAAATAAADAAAADAGGMLEAAEAAFRYGEASVTDLLDVHRAATEADLALLEITAAALAAERELERLGPPSPLPVSSLRSIVTPKEKQE